MKRANYRAPRGHREVLIVPAPEALPQLCADNRALLATHDFMLLGRPVQDVRHDARRRLLSLPYSCAFGRQPRESEISPDAPIILTGHQPELYHPGVWLKNFLAGHLGEVVGGAAVNLNVDNDESHQLTIRAPIIDGSRVRVVEVPYLRPTHNLPFEELDASYLLDGVADALSERGVDEVLCESLNAHWQRLIGALHREKLPRVIACARHQAERAVGLDNKETQVSDIAQFPEFRRFVLDILSRLEAFHAAHNGGLATFRRVHHEKNAAQPVPDLARDGERREVPFWVWPTGGHRQRLWASTGGDVCRLFIDGDDEPFAELACRQLQDDAEEAIATLDAIEERGIKIRPRALTLTLFSRLFLSDVFIHGLGGAMYDKVTDEIARNYFGVEPPRLVMATGTALLPLGRQSVSGEDRRRLQHRLRDIRHNPERLMAKDVAACPEVRELVAGKRDLIAQRRATRTERSEAWRRVHDVNRQLSALLDGEPGATRGRLQRIEQKLADNAILRNREYTFALYPRDELVDFYRQATAVRPGGTS
jgi:hypothetical protein